MAQHHHLAAAPWTRRRAQGSCCTLGQPPASAGNPSSTALTVTTTCHPRPCPGTHRSPARREHPFPHLPLLRSWPCQRLPFPPWSTPPHTCLPRAESAAPPPRLIGSGPYKGLSLTPQPCHALSYCHLLWAWLYPNCPSREEAPLLGPTLVSPSLPQASATSLEPLLRCEPSRSPGTGPSPTSPCLSRLPSLCPHPSRPFPSGPALVACPPLGAGSGLSPLPAPSLLPSGSHNALPRDLLPWGALTCHCVSSQAC